jgi:hypothetical protein
MLYAPPIDRSPAMRSVASLVTATRDYQSETEDRFDVTRRHIPSPLEVGDTVYSLRSQLLGTFYPGRFHVDGVFVVPELFPVFIGRGRNSHDAFLDWRDQVHCQFQILFAKRPFEMTSSEKETWHLLDSLFDVTAYRASTPLTVRQIGKVLQLRPYPKVIKWDNGKREEVRLDQMPAEFAAFKSGQPFVAIVVRDPTDFRLLKVTHIERIPSLPLLSTDEFNELIEAIPTSKSLPSVEFK